MRSELSRLNGSLKNGETNRRSERREFRERLASRESTIHDLEAKQARLNVKRRRMKATLLSRERELNNLQAELGRQRTAVTKLQQDVARWFRLVVRLRESRTYRLTAPLRASVALARDLAKRANFWRPLPAEATPMLASLRRSTRSRARAIRRSGLFDDKFYMQRYPSVVEAGRAALMHFVISGARKGWQPHPLFDPQWYVEQAGAKKAGSNPLLHYLEHGVKKRRSPNRLFDVSFYLAHNLDAAGTGVEPLAHYMAVGAAKGSNPHPLFDTAFYLERNPEVAAAGRNPLEHYLTSGGAEGRDPHPLFHSAFYLDRNPDVRASGENPLVHFLRVGARKKRDPNPWFDTSFYLDADRRLRASGENPLVHFLRIGAEEGRATGPDFDTASYGEAHPDVAASGVNPLTHFILVGKAEGRPHQTQHPTHDRRELPDRFDSAAYLELNPDLKGSGIDPVGHYLKHGRPERRAYCYPRIELENNSHFRADRDSVLVVSHDGSRTGAPIITLSVVSNLVARYNVVALLLGDGPLKDSFTGTGATTVVSNLRRDRDTADSVVGQLHEQFRFKFALVNSIESRIVLKPLAVRYVPVVSLIHEFEAYTRPRDAFPVALLWSTEVVFSADIIRQSVLQQAACSDALAVHTIPQGRWIAPQDPEEDLEEENERLRRLMRPEGSGEGLVIILGAGWVQLRKGVDLFIDVAARVLSAPGGSQCRFVWVGYGYDPDDDVQYSVYLADQIQRAGLEEHIFFAGETRAIEAAYEEADVFLMSSRLDPLPNVAIEALAHGKPVVCFDKATGIADFLKESGLEGSCVAGYLDTADMADKIRTLASSKTLRQEVGEKGREASNSYFNMTDYIRRLEAVAGKAAERSRREEQDVELTVGSGLFRLDFWRVPPLATMPLDQAVRLHVRNWASGIGRRKPFPGFHPGVYLEQHGVTAEGCDPTADYIRAGRPDGPWAVPVITAGAGDVHDLPADERVALHLHVYYPDLLPDIMSHLEANRCRPDLLVSVTSEEAYDLVARRIEAYSGRIAAIEVVPNRGRDVGPFLTQFGRRILSEYAYVGHIHTKKTEVLKDKDLGRIWFRFLMENLLGGSSGAMADTILAFLKADPSLGLVFPDDPNALGWNANRRFAEELASKLGITELPQHFNFPVGTMFWARTSALSPLLDLNLQWDDYPREPVPYDGTLLHAIERFWPLLLQRGTLRPAVTNVAGVTR
jgi:glycosyltransferase involved in cell wall biosynthesis